MSHRVEISIKNAPAEGFKLAVVVEFHPCEYVDDNERQEVALILNVVVNCQSPAAPLTTASLRPNL